MPYEFKEVLFYLEEWRDIRDIRRKFCLSNSERTNLMKFLIGGKFVEMCPANNIHPSKRNKTFLYRVVKN